MAATDTDTRVRQAARALHLINRLAPPCGHARLPAVVIEWFSSTTCVPPTATSTDTFHTVVVAPAGICHTVPGSSAQNTPTTGYIVTCNDAGTGGVFQTCNSNNCGSCGTNTPFTNGACLPNPANTGSNSVRLQCVNNGTSSVASIAASGAAFLGAAAGIAQLF